LNASGRLAAVKGDADGARTQWIDAKQRAVEFGDRVMEAVLTVNLGNLAAVSGDYRAGLEYASEAEALFRELDHKSGQSVALLNVGWSAHRLGDAVLAASSFREGLVVAGSIGAMHRIADGAVGLGVALITSGATKRGVQLLGAAQSLHDELGKGLNDESEEELHSRAVAAARAALGEGGFTAAWTRGQAMTPEEIVEFAVDEVEESA
jgi:hypothetical protein